MKKDKRDIIVSLGLFVLAILLLAAMLSYSPYDISFETSSPNLHIRNYIGIVGAHVAWFIFKIIGHAGFLIPFLCVVWGIGILAERLEQKNVIRFLGTALLFCSSTAFFSLTAAGDGVLTVTRGGIIGLFLSKVLLGYFGNIGSYIITVTLGILALLIATEFLIIPLASFLFLKVWNIFGDIKKEKIPKQKELFKRKEQFKEKPRLRPAVKIGKDILKAAKETVKETPKKEIKPEERPVLSRIILPKPKPVIEKPIKIEPRIVGDYKMPTLDLLSTPPPESERMMSEDLETSARMLEETLEDFGIEVKVVNITKGPVVTRYELQPAPGVKVNRITALNDDIALVMKASTVRIVAPIPGKSAVGIEVPNQSSTLVYLKELLESKEYQKLISYGYEYTLPFLKRIISIVEPSTVICFGNGDNPTSTHSIAKILGYGDYYWKDHKVKVVNLSANANSYIINGNFNDIIIEVFSFPHASKYNIWSKFLDKKESYETLKSKIIYNYT